MSDEAAVQDVLREQLTDLLRRVRPRIVFVVAAGEKRKMDTGGGKGVRYSQLARVIIALPGLERVELCGPKGDLIEQWHPAGQIVEDEAELEPQPQVEIPAGLANLPAALVGEVLNVCMNFAQQQVLNVQRAVDHAMDRRQREQKDLISGFVELVKGSNQRLDVLERQQTNAYRLIQKGLEMQSEARVVAAQAAAALENPDGIDPNSPDGMAVKFINTALERALPAGAPGAAAPAQSPTSPSSTPAPAKGQPLTKLRDHDEKGN